jgi:Carboxypeptidase regulatory-like domain
MLSFRRFQREETTIFRAASSVPCLSLLWLLGCGHSAGINPNAPSNPTPTPPAPGTSAYAVSGAVHEAAPTQTKPVSGARISVLTADGNPIPGASALADQAGAFRIEGVQAGAAILIAQADGYDIAQQRLTIDHGVDGIAFELLPQGDQQLDLQADCAVEPQVLQFPVHRDGTVRLEGTVRGFKLDYVYFTLSLDGTTHVADDYVAVLAPGEFANLQAAVTGGAVYRASIAVKGCFPAELRVIAPR